MEDRHLNLRVWFSECLSNLSGTYVFCHQGVLGIQSSAFACSKCHLGNLNGSASIACLRLVKDPETVPLPKACDWFSLVSMLRVYLTYSDSMEFSTKHSNCGQVFF